MPDSPWPDTAQAALSLTFDDARSSQMDVGIPILNEHGIRGTFFVSYHAAEERLTEWKAAAASGHEIGNHTQTHPCSGCFDFVRERGNALEDYDLRKMAADIDQASAWIADRFGARPTSFAYPCGQTFVGRGIATRSYVPLIAERFLAGRLFRSEAAVPPRHVDLAQVFALDIDRIEPEAAIQHLEDGFEAGHWIILAGHEVAPDHQQGILPVTLNAVCQWARKKDSSLWTDTVSAVAAHINNLQNNHD